MRFKVYESDCVEFMRGLEDNTVDAIVTDPPYGLEFMGKAWDKLTRNLMSPQSEADQERKESYGQTYAGRRSNHPDIGATAKYAKEMQEWHRTWAVEALRVLKPGGHLLAFGGSRTYHRLACAIEDAGFEIRDTIHSTYLSGFPKSHNVGRSIDKSAGAEREVIGHGTNGMGRMNQNNAKVGYRPNPYSDGVDGVPITAPATDAAKQWDGWGTALKPSHEPIVVARKPLVGTVAANVEAFGTGAINIDACRVSWADGKAPEVGTPAWGGPAKKLTVVPNQAGRTVARTEPNSVGRWPPNTLLTHGPECRPTGVVEAKSDGHWPKVRGSGSDCASGCPVAALDQAKEGGSRVFPTFDWMAEAEDPVLSEIAAQGFMVYAPKAPVREREAGLTGDGRVNLHPTVKPISLMRWLIRLVTPPGGIVFDPFTGSGTTGCAAVLEGFDFLGVEKDPAYVELARKRIEHWAKRAI